MLNKVIPYIWFIYSSYITVINTLVNITLRAIEPGLLVAYFPSWHLSQYPLFSIPPLGLSLVILWSVCRASEVSEMTLGGL